MKRESVLIIIIIILMGNCFYMFRSKISADEKTNTLKDSISDYYRPLKIAYTRSNTTLKYTDSLFESGFIINLTGSSREEILRRMNRTK